MKINQYSPPVPLNKRISSFLLNAILYPYSVIKKYNEYNIRITEIANELKDEGIFRIKKNNKENDEFKRTIEKKIFTFDFPVPIYINSRGIY